MDSSLKILLYFFWAAAHAADISLMLSPIEQEALTGAQNQAQKNDQAKNSHTLRLNGIVYTHPTSWTIWINGQPIKTGESVQTLRILKVTPDFVEMIWSPQPGQQHQICLKPNEAFQGVNIP